MKKEHISILVDIETAYPLNMDDIMLTIETDEKENEKDELEDFAKKIKL